MNNILLFVAVGVILAVIIGGIVFRKVQRTRAAKQAEQFAQQRGWRYVASDNSVLTSYPQLFPFYVSGRSTSRPGTSFGDSSTDEARDVLHLKSGEYPAQSFTYSYTTYDEDSGKSSSAKTRLWHIVGLELPVPFPSLIVRRRRRLELPQARLTKPVELPSADLNAMYSVHSEHQPAAFEIMTPEMVQWLLTEQFQDEMVLQDHRLYVFSKGRQRLENIDLMLTQLSGFLSRIPAEAWQKAQGEYPRPARVQMFEALDLSKMTDAYKEWRNSD